MKKFYKDHALLFNTNNENLMKFKNINLILTSPPYNIGSKSSRKDGYRKFGKYDPKSFGGITGYSDFMSEEDYQNQQKDFLRLCSNVIEDDGVILYNHKPRHKKGEFIKPESWFPNELILHDEIIWDRGSTHNHAKSFLFQHTERVYVLKKSRTAKIYFNNKDGNYEDNDLRSDIWRINRANISNKHNAPFPLKLAMSLIRKFCPENGKVCDPYSGSGTTMIASILTNREFLGFEEEEKYFDYSIDRFNKVLVNN